MKTLLIFLLSISFCLAQSQRHQIAKKDTTVRVYLTYEPYSYTLTSNPPQHKPGPKVVIPSKQFYNKGERFIPNDTIPVDPFPDPGLEEIYGKLARQPAQKEEYPAYKVIDGDTLDRYEYYSSLPAIMPGTYHMPKSIGYRKRDDQPAAITYGQLKQILERLKKLEEQSWPRYLFHGEENDPGSSPSYRPRK